MGLGGCLLWIQVADSRDRMEIVVIVLCVYLCEYHLI